MIGMAIALLGRLGLSDERSEKLAPWALGFAGIVLLGALFAIWDHFDDRDAIERDRLEGNNAALEAQVEAEVEAGEQRVEDLAEQIRQQEDYQDAIDNPEAGDSDDPAVRLACERLRNDGQDTRAIPGCGGR